MFQQNACEIVKYARFVGKRDIPTEQAARVMAMLRARLEREHGGNAQAFSRELEISQSGLWQLLNDRTRPSLATAQALAGVLGVGVDTVLDGPLQIAARICRAGGVPESAVQHVLERWANDESKPALVYIEMMKGAAALSPEPTAPSQSQTFARPALPARAPRSRAS